MQKDDKAPDTKIATPAEKMSDIVLTPEEKEQLSKGTDIKIVLDVKDVSDTVSSGDKALAEAALSGDGAAKGFALISASSRLSGRTATPYPKQKKKLRSRLPCRTA